MNLCPNHDRELILGFCDVFVKRASIGHVGMGTEPTPIQYWNRRFQSLPELEQVKLAAFAQAVAPVLLKNALYGLEYADDAARAMAAAGRPVLRAADDIQAGMRALRAGEGVDVFRPAAGLSDEAANAAARAAAPYPFRPLPPAPEGLVPPPSAAATGATGAAGATGAVDAAADAAKSVPGWLQRPVDAWRNMGLPGRALTLYGVGMPVYQLSQGEIGPGQFAAGVGGSLLTMGMGLPTQLLGSMGAPWAAGKFVDPMLGWKPQEQRMQEAQLAGQQQMLSAVQQQLASQPPPMPQAPQFSAGNGITISGPYGTQMRPDLTMPFQMAQRQAIEQQFPGL